jgi:hypothetical protein
MNLGTPEILPPVYPPMYCSSCGCEVDPAAWLCATCGRNVHEAGATTPTRPFAPATSKNNKPDRYIEARIFGTILVVGFWTLYEGLKWDWIPRNSPGHLYGWAVTTFWVAFLIILWADGFFERRR